MGPARLPKRERQAASGRLHRAITIENISQDRCAGVWEQDHPCSALRHPSGRIHRSLRQWYRPLTDHQGQCPAPLAGSAVPRRSARGDRRAPELSPSHDPAPRAERGGLGAPHGPGGGESVALPRRERQQAVGAEVGFANRIGVVADRLDRDAARGVASIFWRDENPPRSHPRSLPVGPWPRRGDPWCCCLPDNDTPMARESMRPGAVMGNRGAGAPRLAGRWDLLRVDLKSQVDHVGQGAQPCLPGCRRCCRPPVSAS